MSFSIEIPVLFSFVSETKVSNRTQIPDGITGMATHAKCEDCESVVREERKPYRLTFWVMR